MLLASIVAACSGSQGAPTGAPPPLPEVGFITVTPQAQEVRTELPGRTRAAQSAEVRPQVGGIIQQRLFTEGSWVKAGQVLYVIDAPGYEAAVRSADAALAKAQTVARSARVNADRHAVLVKENAVSRQAYEDSQAQAAQAAADVAVAQAALANARINLQYSRITAPISGLVDLSSVSVGALVAANQPQALTTISQLDPIQVDITQSSTELLELKRKWQAGAFGKVEAGAARVQLLLEDGSAYPHPGRLQFTGASVRADTGAITLRAVFPNPQQLLMPGMYVRAQLATGRNEQAILVPQQAVQRDGAGNPSVQVIAAGDKVEKRPIDIGQAVGNQWLVTAGLQAG
ncbi:MAG TPA: efflux RND transporter periplasmic adaptor subunit, partial [Ramlibacter sp.]|nr:efflux RND transporter periplasmic adaptor subunit [Ramlibacter sp.]